MVRPIITLALLAVTFQPLTGADVRLDGVKFGDVLVGPKLKSGDLKGRVVLVELWGVH